MMVGAAVKYPSGKVTRWLPLQNETGYKELLASVSGVMYSRPKSIFGTPSGVGAQIAVIGLAIGLFLLASDRRREDRVVY
jgi:hypothetical protein